jgi:hypothetical protein
MTSFIRNCFLSARPEDIPLFEQVVTKEHGVLFRVKLDGYAIHPIGKGNQSFCDAKESDVLGVDSNESTLTV